MVALPPLNDPASGSVARPGRRGLLLGAAGVATATLFGCGAEETDQGGPSGASRAVERIRYAEEHPDQHGFFGAPGTGPAKALIVLIHGGYWFRNFGADLTDDAATDLRGLGFATWNIEYRRIGGPDGGYPNTFSDVAAAVDHIPQLPLEEKVPVVLVGHSAGGHLAAWAASRTALTPGGASKVKIARTFTLSGVLDLVNGERENLGNGAVSLLMGGSADQVPDRYALGDPTLLLPAQCPVTVIHASGDDFVPISQSTAYVDADNAAGGEAAFVEVAGDHLDMVQPGSESWTAVRDGLAQEFPG